MDGFNASGVAKRYGKPDDIEPCEDSDIWIYNDPGRFYRNLIK